MTLTALTGTGMALLVSSLVSTERAALTAVPLLLVPQMLLAGALVPYKEMNRGLFDDVKTERENGGVPVPAKIMPLRYAFEGMLIGQATRNPFEIERIRLQRKIDRFRDKQQEPTPKEIENFEMTKEGLRRLLASGARNTKEGQELVSRIRRMVNTGTPIEVSTMKVWPKGDDVRPTYKWFVNDRIELLVREAETFRNDYRNKDPRHVFLALDKPIPFYDLFNPEPDDSEKPDHDKGSPNGKLDDSQVGQIETMKFCGFILLFVSLGCCILSARFIREQNRTVT
jgi:hypothetical protein